MVPNALLRVSDNTGRTGPARLATLTHCLLVCLNGTRRSSRGSHILTGRVSVYKDLIITFHFGYCFKIIAGTGAGHAGDAEDVVGADPEAVQELRRVVGIDHGDDTGRVGGGAYPHQRGQAGFEQGPLLAVVQLFVQIFNFGLGVLGRGDLRLLGIEYAASDLRRIIKILSILPFIYM